MVGPLVGRTPSVAVGLSSSSGTALPVPGTRLRVGDGPAVTGAGVSKLGDGTKPYAVAPVVQPARPSHRLKPIKRMAERLAVEGWVGAVNLTPPPIPPSE